MILYFSQSQSFIVTNPTNIVFAMPLTLIILKFISFFKIFAHAAVDYFPSVFTVMHYLMF